MKIRPIYKSGKNYLVGLDVDFNLPQVQDALVLEISTTDKEIRNPPWSMQKMLKFGEGYEELSDELSHTVGEEIVRHFGADLQIEMIAMLQYPPLDSIDSMIWIPERLRDMDTRQVFRTYTYNSAEFEVDENRLPNEFLRIADVLLLHKALNVNGTIIRFTEIEFYYYCPSHQDAFAHQHDQPAKQWRFHNQGFDFTLRGITGFGGILIRGIEVDASYESDKTVYVNGPRRVLFKTMSYLNAIDQPNNILGLVPTEKRDLRIFQTFRHGLNTPTTALPCGDIDHFKSAKYRFIVNAHLFDRKQFSGAEEIARNFDDKESAYDFLRYNLKL